MTRDEVKQILMVIDATFPNFKVENISETLNAWHFFLADYDYNSIAIALKSFISTNNTGFAPSVSQLINMTYKATEYEQLGDGEAWALVSKAIRNSAYNSQAEFDKLPPAVKKAVGSASQLHTWAIDEDYNESVISSHFLRNYKAVIERNNEYNRLPVEMRAQIDQSARMLIGG